ncbi:MAG: DUF1932 domain-containing protein [Nostocoides sp.]
METLAILGAGAMGAGIARLLTDHGCTVRTRLDGRSAATRKRAVDAGMREATLSEIGECELVLSIVPPAQASAALESVASFLDGVLYCDANAVSPDTKRSLARRVGELGGAFVDGAIIGTPPTDGYDGPRLYVSGEPAEHVATLSRRGLDTRVLAGDIGAAAALKMCYGGLNKGVTGLATAVLLAAQRHDAAQALLAEMRLSMDWLLPRLPAQVAGMYPKAYRWDGEMREIAAFLADEDAAAAAIWDGLGAFYTERATAATTGAEPSALAAMLQQSQDDANR